jgi:hypothetical protein
MNEKKLQFVTYEQAKLLKELGFDWKTSRIFSNNNYIVNNIYKRCNDDYILWSTVALALKWFRGIKKIQNY